ncbi:nitrilase, partial [Aureobasidium melanogenum]|uniref:Nitrilase n=1 Tax=Aureobasidium melanogenum (strain CBS 110374) TaxID=1043003 RepID=A0A074WE36_AURM1
MSAKVLRAAACHVSPVFLSASATTQKAINLIRQASANNANLVVFPETYISAFPIWSAIRAPTENHDLFKRMVAESVYADGPEIEAIRATAQKLNIMVSVGISEKARYSSATLWNSNVLIGSNGEILNHHRKLQPTFFEKLTWSSGDGHGLRVSETPYGKIGNLICGENTNPLARYALMAEGEQIHISTWPAVWPTRALQPDVVVSKGKNYDNLAANRTRAAAHCFEAKCFGIINAAFLDEQAIDIVAKGASNEAGVRQTLQLSQRAATMFLDPTGMLKPGFTVDATTGKKQETDYLQDREDILYTDMDVEECIEGKQYHDVVGGYQRLDVFDLQVDRSRREPARFVEGLRDDKVEF